MWIVAATAAGTEALLPKHKNVKFQVRKYEPS